MCRSVVKAPNQIKQYAKLIWLNVISADKANKSIAQLTNTLFINKTKELKLWETAMFPGIDPHNLINICIVDIK